MTASLVNSGRLDFLIKEGTLRVCARGGIPVHSSHCRNCQPADCHCRGKRPAKGGPLYYLRLIKEVHLTSKIVKPLILA
jgi:hypothetical protein